MATQASDEDPLHSRPDDNERDEPCPGLTVGDLRRALAGVDDALPVIVRAQGGHHNFCGGIRTASAEGSCVGPHFALDCSDEDKDFDA